MNKDSVTLVQLKYATALDNIRNFSRAAEFCHITQPTLSIQLKKLEESLDLVIFDRSKSPLIPTASGEIFLTRARRVLREMDNLIEEVDLIKEDIKGEITIGVIPTLAPYLVPAFIGEFAQQFPGLKIRVQELLTQSIIEELKRDRIDAGLLVGPVLNSEVHLQPLFYEEIMVYLNTRHPLMSESEIDVHQLQSADLWILGEGHCFRDQILNLCTLRNKDNSRSISYESGSLETLKRLVDIEGGFTLVPELSVHAMSPSSRKRIKRIEGVKPLREVSLATARSFNKRRIIDILGAFISESVPKSMLNPERGKVVEWQS